MNGMRETELRGIGGRSAITVGTVVLALSGCSAGSSDDGPLTVGDVRKRQAKLAEAAPCPFAFDVAAAVRAAGVTLPVEPGTPQVEHEHTPARPATPAVPAGPTTPAFPEVPASPAVTLIGCEYKVGDTRLTAHIVAAGARGSAVNMAAPMIGAAGDLPTSDLLAFLRTASTAEPGTVTLTPGAGTVATVRLPVGGDEDLAMVVEVESKADDASPALAGDVLRTITKELEPGARF